VSEVRLRLPKITGWEVQQDGEARKLIGEEARQRLEYVYTCI